MKIRLNAVVCALGIFAGASAAGDEPYAVVSVSGRVDHAIDRNGIVYVTSGSTIVRYDLATQQFLSTFNIGGNLAGLDISPDGQTLAVADTSTNGPSSALHLVDSHTGVDLTINFPLSGNESGTYMAVWEGDSGILISSKFSGSGWVPLRRFDLNTGTTQVLGTIRQDSMLAPSADLTTIGLVEGNISSGPVSAYSVSGGGIVATMNTNSFLYEVAVDPTGHQIAVPSFTGMFIFDLTGSALQLRTILGQTESHRPIGAAYSPISPHLFTAERDSSAATSGIYVYDTTSLTLSSFLDTYPFGPTGNHAFGDGRSKISGDGRWFGVSAGSTVRVYEVSSITNPQVGPPAVVPVPLPATSGIWFLLATLSFVALAWRHGWLRRQGPNYRNI